MTSAHPQQLTNWQVAPARAKPSYKNSLPSQAEKEILANIKRFFETRDDAERMRLVAEIGASKEYDPRRVSSWLHQAGLHSRLKPGNQSFAVSLEDGERKLDLRIPKGYTPDRPWPLIIAFHHTGGTGADVIQLIKNVLGGLIEEFIVVAPNGYTPLNVESMRAWGPEQRLVLRELRRLLHIDSNRIYVTGFSQGCYASWSYATFYGDELAGAAPVACTFDAAPEIPGLWEMLMPNVANIPVLHVWGSEDHLPVFGFDLRTVTGTATELNRRVVDLTKKFNLNVLNYRIRGGGHNYDPPNKLLTELLEKQRAAYPSSVRQCFRYLVQGRAYWLEALSWDSDQWGLKGRSPQPNPGLTREQLIGRLIADLLGHLDGEIVGQNITITTRHVGAFVIWFGEEMIHWTKPVTVSVNGKDVIEGKLTRDLQLCLTEAERTYDFDRLRWAGLQVSKDGSAKVVKATESLPQIVYEKPAN